MSGQCRCGRSWCLKVTRNGGVTWYTRRRKHRGGWARPCTEEFTRREIGPKGRCEWCGDTLNSDGTVEPMQLGLL